MLLHKKHSVLMSPANSKLIKSIRGFGVDVIYSECIEELLVFEQCHADMQLLEINGTAFIPGNSHSLVNKLEKYFDKIIVCNNLGAKYPANIGLNAALVGDKLFCKESAVADKVKEYCLDNSIKIVNVNQGYAKCSTLVVNDNAIITADETIYNAAVSENIRALKIQSGHINLNGADYGFIGGCSGKVGEHIVFFGDINKHPSGDEILNFISNEGAEYVVLSDCILDDIGGLVELS